MPLRIYEPKDVCELDQTNNTSENYIKMY